MATFTISTGRKFYRSSVTQLALRTVVGMWLMKATLSTKERGEWLDTANFAYSDWLCGDETDRNFGLIAEKLVSEAKRLKRAPKRNAEALNMYRIAYVAMTEKDALRAVLRIAELRGDAKDQMLAFAESFLVRSINGRAKEKAAKRKAS